VIVEELVVMESVGSIEMAPVVPAYSK